jgi:hypothetical protein
LRNPHRLKVFLLQNFSGCGGRVHHESTVSA